MTTLRIAVSQKLTIDDLDSLDVQGRLAFYNGLQPAAEWCSNSDFASLIASATGLRDGG